MPRDIGPKSLKMKSGDIATRVMGTLRAVRWKDKQDVYILTNMHAPPVEGNFTDESGQALKPRVVEDYNACMGFVDKAGRMLNSYGIARRKWKWAKILFFPPNRHDHSKRISYPQIVWLQNGAQICPRASRSRIHCPFAR